MYIKWIILAIVCLQTFCFSGSMKANGTILGDMVQQLNTTHSLVAWAFSAQNAVALLITPCVGSLLGVFSYKGVHLMGVLLVGAGYIFCGLYSLTVWKFIVTYIISGVGFGLCTLPTILALEAYHGDKFPAMILIGQLFHFVGVAVMPPILQCLKDRYGLSNSLILYGALMWNLGALGFALRQPPDTNSTNLRRSKDHSQSSNGPQLYSGEKSKMKVSKERAHLSAEGYSRRCCSIIFLHKAFTVTIIGEIFMYIIFISWAIFLVSLGTSLGFTADEAVMLSTAGGVGGLMGKIGAIVLVHNNKLSVFSFWMIPCIINGTSLLALAVVTDFYILMVLTFLTGFGIALSISGLVGTFRMTVCQYHFPQAAQMMEVACGLGIQLGGIISGVLCDVTGEVSLIYALDGVLIIAILPLVLLWKHTEDSPSDCSPYEDDDNYVGDDIK